MKQARALGVGVIVGTQNPMDLDYRALSNAGVWCIGRLQTDADRARDNGGNFGERAQDESVRSVACRILRLHGYAVLEASNGGEALMICEPFGAKIDLLLSGVVLPRMSGRRLAEHLSSLRPELKVLSMSGYTDEAALRQCVLASSGAYLQKPLTPSSLRERLDMSSLGSAPMPSRPRS